MGRMVEEIIAEGVAERRGGEWYRFPGSALSMQE